MKHLYTLFFISCTPWFIFSSENVWLPNKTDSITVLLAKITVLKNNNCVPGNIDQKLFEMVEDLKRVQAELITTQFPQKNVYAMTMAQAQEYFTQALLFLKKQRNKKLTTLK